MAALTLGWSFLAVGLARGVAVAEKVAGRSGRGRENEKEERERKRRKIVRNRERERERKKKEKRVFEIFRF